MILIASVGVHVKARNPTCFRPKRYQLAELIRWFFKLAAHGDEGVGYTIGHIKYNPMFQLKVSFNETIYGMYPAAHVTWEMLEKVIIRLR